MSSGKVIRFDARERVIHWLVALFFLYSALTGLALWSPRLFWMASVFGGGTTVRAWHPWAGVLFAGVFSVMFFSWGRLMVLDADDRRWLKMSHRYAAHDFGSMPEAGRFNGGQKALFWVQSVNLVVLLVTGSILWFPESTSRALREVSILLHSATALVGIGGLIIHVYMGTAATPGAFRGMTQGWVSIRWARSHHPRWHRERE